MHLHHLQGDLSSNCKSYRTCKVIIQKFIVNIYVVQWLVKIMNCTKCKICTLRTVEVYLQNISFCGNKCSWKYETLLRNAQTSYTYHRFRLYWWNYYCFWIFFLIFYVAFFSSIVD